jgi:ribose transport system substrate-binding protein
MPRIHPILVAAASLFAATFSVAQERTVIGVAIPAATHGWTGGVNYWARETERRLERQHPNLDFVVVASASAADQANALDDLVAVRRIQALVILPFESAPLTAPVRRVKESGVFVTVVDRGLSEPGIEDLYVAGDNPGFGRQAGEYIRQRLNGRGNVVVLRGIPTTIDNERVDAFRAALAGSEVQILDAKHGNWNRDDAFRVMQDYLTRFPRIDAVWASDDDMAVGVLEALRQAGREREMFVVGGAGMKEMIKRVMDRDEQVPVNVLYPPAMIATAMELTALRFTAQSPIRGRFVLESTLITPENAAQFYFPDSPF